jgi:uncharacterized protein (UPF0332 family)
MTQHSDISQKEVLVRYWLEKAHESLESARREYEEGRLSFAMNRIYYACFYALTAIFRDKDKMFKKHKGLRSDLHRDLIRNGIVEDRWGKFFDDVFEARQRGDYMPMVTFEPDQLADFLQQAEHFLKVMEKLINR